VVNPCSQTLNPNFNPNNDNINIDQTFYHIVPQTSSITQRWFYYSLLLMNKPEAPVTISQNHTFSNEGLQNSLTRRPKFKAPKFVIKTKTNRVENKYLDNEVKGSRSLRVNVLC
jgi:hypothetical protein